MLVGGRRPLELIPERVAHVARVGLSVGNYHDLGPDGVPQAFGVVGALAYCVGGDASGLGNVCSRPIEALLGGANNATDQAGRQRLWEWVLANVDRLAATVRDGRVAEREYLAADYVVRWILPTWLKVGRSRVVARKLASLPAIVDDRTAREAQVLVDRVSGGLDKSPVEVEVSAKVAAVLRSRVNGAADGWIPSHAALMTRNAFGPMPGDCAGADAAALVAAATVDRGSVAGEVSDRTVDLVVSAGRAADRLARAVVRESEEVLVAGVADAAVEAAGATGRLATKFLRVQRGVQCWVREQLVGVLDAARESAGARPAIEVVIAVLERMVSLGAEGQQA